MMKSSSAPILRAMEERSHHQSGKDAADGIVARLRRRDHEATLAEAVPKHATSPGVSRRRRRCRPRPTRKSPRCGAVHKPRSMRLEPKRFPACEATSRRLPSGPHRSCSADLDAATSSPSSTRPSRPTEGDDQTESSLPKDQTGTDPRRSQRALLGLGCVPYHRRGVRHEGRAAIKAAMKATSPRSSPNSLLPSRPRPRPRPNSRR